ncbi:MAG: MotA/TolQ/ExbB proton channel family protein [Fimbriiglobus sp.]|nr:MotA/TolQ/ExbB proton channel family protein [Fimbriiglobus sp.]
MSVPSSARLPREWLLLVVALVLVGLFVVPFWTLIHSADELAQVRTKWNAHRVGQLLLGVPQVVCYLCCAWAGLILVRRYVEVRRQRAAFGYELLPTDEGARILPEDARPLSRKVDQTITRRGPSILANMIRLGLNKYAISKSGPDVAEVVRTQADVEQARQVATMNTVNYLAWAIPAVGFLGTVLGLAEALIAPEKAETQGHRSAEEMLTEYTRQTDAYLSQVTGHLGSAFDCTFVALALSLVLMYLLHAVQKAEETLIIDCQNYCQEHLLLRLYDPPSTGERPA